MSDISNSISSEVILNKFATSEHERKIIIGIPAYIKLFYTNKIIINVNSGKLFFYSFFVS